MATTLVTIAPSVPASPTWSYITCNGCGTDLFAYNLHADWTTWQTWAYQVDEPTIYDVSYRTALNRTKFSAFILQVQCKHSQQNDGCIIKSQSNGAIAFLSASGNTSVDTYRLSENEFKTIFTDATFSTSQSNTYTGANLTATKVGNTDPAIAQQYFDYAKCTTVAGSPAVTECHFWQPDWRLNDDGTDPVTDGYPRIGTEEEGTTVAYMDADGTTAIQFDAYSFMSANALAAAGVALLSIYAF